MLAARADALLAVHGPVQTRQGARGVHLSPLSDRSVMSGMRWGAPLRDPPC